MPPKKMMTRARTKTNKTNMKRTLTWTTCLIDLPVTLRTRKRKSKKMRKLSRTLMQLRPSNLKMLKQLNSKR